MVFDNSEVEQQFSLFDVVEQNSHEITLSSAVSDDDTTRTIKRMFDYEPEEGIISEKITIPEFPEEFQIGLIVGSSGSGKSTILRTVFDGGEEKVEWEPNKSIASHFKDAKEASERFGAVGLNSIPSWLKPYSVLSNGEKFRADMARRLKDGAAIDEFTSVVNRDVAISCSVSIEKYIRQNRMKNIVFASCHDDIVPYLQPDWVYNTDTHAFYNGRYLCRPKINIKIVNCDKKAWNIFKRHHYLTSDINNACVAYMALCNDLPIGFLSVLAFPSKNFKHAWREHRVVILPDYQGMGIGNRLSETIAQAYVECGCRYFGKTANPRMGEHRDKSPLWRATSKNHVIRKDYINYQKRDWHGMASNAMRHVFRDCYSHEYIGDGKTYPYTLEGNETKVIENVQMSLFDLL